MYNEINSYDELLNLYFDDNGYNGYYYNQTENSKFSSNGSQWKIHLFLNKEKEKFPDFKSHDIKKISKFLVDKDVEHKFVNGCDGYKTMCIYSGSFEDSLNLAKEINEQFDLSKYGKLPDDIKDDDEKSELFLSDRIGIRFSTKDYYAKKDSVAKFSRYGYRGIPYAFPTVDLKSLSKIIDKKDKFKFKSILGHIKLAEMYGENYLGKDYEKTKWDKGIFSSLAKKYGIEETKKIISFMKNEPVNKLISKKEMKNQRLVADSVEIDIDNLLVGEDRNGKILDNLKVKAISDKWDKNKSNDSRVSDIVSRF